MTDMIALRTFGGEAPVNPPHLLPDDAAQLAEFCDFTHGHLAPMKAGLLVATMSGTVKTIYTEDGINFFTWPTEAYALRTPVQKDPYDRVYYLAAGVPRVTTTAGMAPTGGAPGSSWKLGVPRPTVAPTLALVSLTEYPDYPSCTVELTAWWEYNGERYQSTTPTLTQVTRLVAYTFVAPARVDPTPANAVVRATLVFKGTDGKPFMTVTLASGDTDTRSSALPGGVTFSLANSGGVNFTIGMTYGVVETRAYTYAAVNNWQEESPPGPPAQIATTYLQAVTVTLTALDFTDYRPLSLYRTYRTMGASASYLLVHESATLSYSDGSYKASDVLGAMETLDYESPPALLDAMIALVGGSFAGFKGNTLYITEPYRPHSWQYQLSFLKNIRGICEAPQSIVVTTAEGCHVVAGNHPSSLQPMRLPVPQAGVSQRAMVNVDGATIFASNDGMVAVVGANASMDGSQKLFARDDWQARYGAILADASMRFGYHDGRLVASSSTQALGFMLSIDGADAGQCTRMNVLMDAMFQLPVTDTLYYSVGANVYRFRAGADLTYAWQSRDFIFSKPTNLGAGYIRCSGSVTLTVYMDGVQWHQVTLPGSGYFRLPSGRKRQRFSVKLQGTSVVEEFYLAPTMTGLKRV